MATARTAFAQRFRLLTLLSASLVAGAVYDLAFAFLMVAAPEVPGKLLKLPLPGETFYLWLTAVLLVMLACFYLLAARDARRYSGIIAVAIAGRLAGAVALGLAAAGRPDLAGLWPLAAADFLFAAAHAAFWLPLRS